MTTPAKKARAKLLRRPIGLTVVRAVIVDEHGVMQCGADGRPEIVGVLAPSHPIDRRSMRERKFGVGTQLRAELRKDRNPGFWRKAHVLGGWLSDNVELFAGLGMHDALKKLQTESGIGCVTADYEIPGVGTLTRNEPESLNFSDMDEGRWNELWNGWMEWLRANAWPGLEAAQIDEVEELISGNGQ